MAACFARCSTAIPYSINKLTKYFKRNSISQMKKCIMCTKEIDKEAKRCPHCQSGQAFFEKHKNILPFCFLALFLLFAFLPQIRYYFSYVEFAPYINDISISESSVRFRSDSYGVQAIIMGKLNNETAYSWKDVLFELSLYNENNELIDTMQTKSYGIFPAGQSLQFKIQVPVELGENKYSNFKLKIITATHKYSWDYY